jgi:hypothetical protein
VQIDSLINHGLKVVRRILNLAQSEWLNENGLTWLAAAPKIKLFGSMATLEEIVDSMLWLCSERNGFMNGASIVLDVGLTAC